MRKIILAPLLFLTLLSCGSAEPSGQGVIQIGETERVLEESGPEAARSYWAELRVDDPRGLLLESELRVLQLLVDESSDDQLTRDGWEQLAAKVLSQIGSDPNVFQAYLLASLRSAGGDDVGALEAIEWVCPAADFDCHKAHLSFLRSRVNDEIAYGGISKMQYLNAAYIIAKYVDIPEARHELIVASAAYDIEFGERIRDRSTAAGMDEVDAGRSFCEGLGVGAEFRFYGAAVPPQWKSCEQMKFDSK